MSAPARRPATDGGHLAAVTAELTRDRPPDEPQLLVVAYAHPDGNGHQTVASYVNWQLGGTAHSFALCAPDSVFAALVVVRAYLVAGNVARALVVAVDDDAAAFVPVGGDDPCPVLVGEGDEDAARAACARSGVEVGRVVTGPDGVALWRRARDAARTPGRGAVVVCSTAPARRFAVLRRGVVR